MFSEGREWVHWERMGERVLPVSQVHQIDPSFDYVIHTSR